MIVVEEKSFFSFMKNEFETHNGNIIILDSNNVPIVKKENAEYLYTEDFISLLENFDTDGFMQTKLLGVDYIISVLKSDSPAFTYVSLTPVDALLEELNITKRNTLFLVFIIVAAGLILIAFAMIINYRPINIIKKHILSRSEEWLSNTDDFQLIQQVIMKLQNENKELVNRILLNKNIVSSISSFNL